MCASPSITGWFNRARIRALAERPALVDPRFVLNAAFAAELFFVTRLATAMMFLLLKNI